MSSTVGSGPLRSLARRKPPLRVVLAKGQNVRAFTVRPWFAASCGIIGAVFGVLYLTATGYLVFRDDLLAASIARQARMQHAYEDRIASLRADIDRLTSRQLLNQQAFDDKMGRLLDRQAALDARQDVIAGLSQAARRAGIAPGEPADAAAPPPSEAAAPTPRVKTSSATPIGPAPVAEAALRAGTTENPLPASGEPPGIGIVETSLDLLAREQVAYVEEVASKVGEQTDKMAFLLKKLGHEPPGENGDESGVGGPFIPLADNVDPDTFRSSVAVVTDHLERFAAMRRFAGKLPLAKPIPDATVTSSFGPRLDPFFRRPALHSGVDFRAPSGYPIRATAGGTVVAAAYTRGYGRMVEIDHGNGVTTRFAHLSQILVKRGQVVAEGALIGRAGSTGRSTGPHLHYEVRVDGRASDPMRYIKAGAELTPLL